MASDFFTSATSNAVGTLMVEYLVKPVGRRVRYLFRFNDIVEGFREQKTALTSAQTRLQVDVKEAKRQNIVIKKDVEDWLEEAKNVLHDVQSLESRIEENQRCFKCYPNWCCGYGLCKKIDQRSQAIAKLVKKSKFDRIGHRATLPGIEFFSSMDLIESKSLTSAFNEIMEALKKHDEIDMIGVWGTEGVGKTTLVKKVGKKAQELQLKVVMAVVSQNLDIGKIQDKIADFLDLKFGKKTQEGKAEELWLRLKNEKRILIILDDVEKELSLRDIGIPFGKDHKGCKIIFTTRKEKICHSMESQVMVSLGVLDEEEAWTLFKMNARLGNASPEIIKVAREIVKECKGLPKAVVTLAKALRGKSLNAWELACGKVKSSRLMDIEYLQEEDKKILASVLN